MIKVNDKILNKYADLAVNVGLNLKKGQPVLINTSVDAAYFARICAEKCYEAGASYVYMKWNDAAITKTNFLNADISEFETIPKHTVAEYDYYMDRNIARLNIIDDVPGYFADVDSQKMQASAAASGKALSRFRAYSMGNVGQWTIVAVPSLGWAKQVFPNDTDTDAVDKLWDAILKASRVNDTNDPIAEWSAHNERLSRNNEILNKHNFKSLHFKNSLGTDITVDLADHHRWAGGAEKASNGQIFNPNIPTEENFTMPHRDRVNGVVYASKPLDYQGTLIEDFMLEFKDGKVVHHQAKKNEATLTSLLETDEGSRHIGEIALLPHDSPIQNSGILFYNTLFDENASCHMALGAAYPMNIIGGTEMEVEQLKQYGFNESVNHVDFMFGSADMQITGIKADGTEVAVFENGNFVI